MLKFGIFAFALVFLILSTRVAFAETCALAPIFSETTLSNLRTSRRPPCEKANYATPMPNGKVIGSGIIYLYANDEAKYSSLNNVLHAIKQLEGKTIYPGETFSFNLAANLLQENIPYDLGPDVRNNLVKAGGVCMISTMIATAAHDAGLPFVDARGKIIPLPIPHSRFYKYYHQINRLNNRAVAITEAAIAIKKDKLGQPWETVQDLRFINNTGHPLVLHFAPSFTVNDLDLSKPFGHIQANHTLLVELRAVPNGLDAWFNRLEHLSFN